MGQRAFTLTLSLRCVCLWSIPSNSTHTSVGRKDSADSVVLALRIMGTLEGMKTTPSLTFDGTAKQWPAFKQKLLKYSDSQNHREQTYFRTAGRCAHLQFALGPCGRIKRFPGGSFGEFVFLGCFRHPNIPCTCTDYHRRQHVHWRCMVGVRLHGVDHLAES